jgi:hypothetical protein
VRVQKSAASVHVLGADDARWREEGQRANCMREVAGEGGSDATTEGVADEVEPAVSAVDPWNL